MRTCCLLLLIAVPVRAADDDTAAVDLARAIKKSAALDRYAFHAEEPSSAVDGKYHKGKPAWFEADRIELFREGDLVVYKDSGAWQRSRTGRLSDPLRVLGAVARARTTRLPHEELAALDGHIKNVSKAEAKEGSAYSGTLDEAALKRLARTEHRDVAREGKVRAWVGSDGLVTKYEVEMRLQGKLGNAEIDGMTTRTVTLREAGTAKVEVPDAAKKALE